MISSVILAAGMSTRMGKPKQLLRLDGKTLIRIVSENVLASRIDEVLVVTGYRGDKVAAEVAGMNVKVVHNPEYGQGQGVSLALGVRNTDRNASAILVFTCDQPLISGSLIDSIIEEYEKSGSPVLRPVCGGVPGHPVVFSSSLRGELETLKGDEGACGVLRRLGDVVKYLPVKDEAVVFDIDTQEDFEMLKVMMDRKSRGNDLFAR